MKPVICRGAKTQLLVGTCLTLMAAPLSAQDAEETSGNVISEIVVTAQKREQNLRKCRWRFPSLVARSCSSCR